VHLADGQAVEVGRVGGAGAIRTNLATEPFAASFRIGRVCETLAALLAREMAAAKSISECDCLGAGGDGHYRRRQFQRHLWPITSGARMVTEEVSSSLWLRFDPAAADIRAIQEAGRTCHGS